MKFPSPEFDDAVAAACHGTASEAQLSSLAALLREDGRARDEYLLRVDLHARLASDVGLHCEPKVPIHADRSRRLLWPPRPWPTSAAAAVLLAVAVGVISRRTDGPLAPAETRKASTDAALATIVRSAGAVFATPEVLATPGAGLHRESVLLTEGVIELTTALGARVVIEAPADFQFENGQRLHLRSGRAAAEVPPAAKGFTIVTSKGEAIDLGTKFGVDVPVHGAPEIHVFEGEVVTQRNGGTGLQTLRGGEALALAASGNSNRELRSAAFIQDQEMGELAAGWRSSRYQGWLQHLAAVRADAALVALIQLNESMPVDQKKGKFRLVQGRWPGTQAAEFLESGDSLPVQFDHTTSGLTMLAWVRLDRLNHAIHSLYHSHNWEQLGDVHWMVLDGQRMRFAVYGMEFLPDRKSAWPESRRTVSAADGRWVNVAVTYSCDLRSVRFYVDGEFDNEILLHVAVPAALRPGLIGNWNQTRWDGERNLSGRLDEMIVLARVLNDAEIRAAFDAGNPYATDAPR